MKTPITLRVRLAFGTYQVGYIFHSPPLSGTLRQEWLNRGLLEVVEPKPEPPKVDERKPPRKIR